MCPYGAGRAKQGNRIFHREKVGKSGSSPADKASTRVNSTMPAASDQELMKIIITSDCMMIMRVLARSVLLAIALAAFPLFYVGSNNADVLCEWPNINPMDCDSNAQRAPTVLTNLDEYHIVKFNNEDGQKQWMAGRVETFSVILHDLKAEGLLKTGDRALCIGSGVEEGLNGIWGSLGLDMILGEKMANHMFPDNSFDFEFTCMYDMDSFPAAEIERTLKIGGVAAIHLSLKKQSDLMMTSPSNTVVQLFPNFKIVYVRRFDALGLDTVIAFRKVGYAVNQMLMLPKRSNQCLVTNERREAMKKMEQILLEHPRASWIESKQYLNNVRYLPNLLGYSSNSSGYVYVDVGANSYESSIGSWFEPLYPKQNHKFDIFAIEADGSFGADYSDHPEVKFLPYAAWIKNETLTFGSYEKQGGGISVKPKLSRVRGLDLASWLMKTVTKDDYVVMKMDVGGTEFQILPRMVKTGAICLIDELFLECHYESLYKKYKRAYWECLTLYGILREEGVLVHQWWG